MNYKLFDRVISAYKVRGKQIEEKKKQGRVGEDVVATETGFRKVLQKIWKNAHRSGKT